MIGSQRAFYGNQFGLTFPVFAHYGVQLWVPEGGGAVDPGYDAHDLVMSLYGGMSKGERKLTKDEIRALVASLHDMMAVLRDANPADKAAVYAELGSR